jgi:hypothetical protein
MSTFFLSYTLSDQPWAEWISWHIEEAGHRAIVQSWDFRPGSNFVLEMQKASRVANATIAVLSSEYIEKAFPSAEWAAALVKDPNGQKLGLIPVRVSDVEPPGLLSSIVYIDLVHVANEEEAVSRLLNGIDPGRGKPASAPIFPKHQKRGERPPYPLASATEVEKLVSGRDEIEIELKINRGFEDFTAPEQEKLIRAIRELLRTGSNLKVTKTIRGSVVVRLRLTRKDAMKLIVLNHVGKLRSLRVTDVVVPDNRSPSIDEAMLESLGAELDPPIVGMAERGTIVFLDLAAGYGIIERDRGGFMKFEESSDSVQPEKKEEAGSRTQPGPEAVSEKPKPAID